MTNTTWLVDWSDTEHREFTIAWRQEGLAPRVIRSRPLGPTVGTRLHRLHSYPAYTTLALRGVAVASGPLVAWQPIAGMVAAGLRRGARPPLVFLNPILDRGRKGPKERIALAALRRGDQVLVYGRRDVDHLCERGLDRSRVRFVPLGVLPGARPAPTSASYLLAAGRSHRDWRTLSAAARGLPLEVVVLGPQWLRRLDHCRISEETGKDGFSRLLRDAAALVVPLHDDGQPAGTLALLRAMAHGRAVVATRGPGTEDYVTPDFGSLVRAGDVRALHAALREACDPQLARTRGAAAYDLASDRFSLGRFVREVEHAAHGDV